MIPRTFPSIIEALQTKMVVYVLPSITGLTAWIDYIPVKGVTTESNALANTYALDGYQVVKTIESLTGKQAWLDYIPVFESAAYNKPWSTDANGYIPAGGLFSVASLFAAGEQGTWYDPSDLTTLFQDSAGTTPVTAVQQPVGLMLDKSKGLVLGPELVLDSSFAVPSAWTPQTSEWVVSGGKATYTKASTSVTYLQSNDGVPITSGKWYEVRFVISGATPSVAAVILGLFNVTATINYLGSYQTYVTNGENVIRFLANATSTGIRIYANGGGASPSWSLDNISVKELPGNHAFQTTSASRPVLSARYNLLTKTEQFDDAVWTKNNVTVSANAAVAPDGTTTADLVYPTSTGSNCWFYTSPSNITSAAHAYSIRAKFAGIRWLFILKSNGQAGAAWFDLQNGVVGTVASGYTATIKPDGNGYYACSVNAPSELPSFLTYTGPASSDNSLNVTANGTDGIYIWGADLRVSNDALSQPAYQRVNTATDYDTVGFKPYLAFDGVDDSLVTNSIDFTSTDKMTVFAGVRKLSDAALAIVAETGTSGNDNGSFTLFAPRTATLPSIGFRSRGTAEALANNTVSYASPVTAVVSGIGDISGDQAILRINGTQAAINTADQGTGNYGNYPLFIGRRNQASLPFNGRLYSLIVRGAASTTAQITSTETYVNQKTGAY